MFVKVATRCGEAAGRRWIAKRTFLTSSPALPQIAPTSIVLNTDSHSTDQVYSTEKKLLKVAIIGTPNAGKSTLINQLIGQKVFAVSPKVHTTIRKAAGIMTEDNTQVVLMDTPGILPHQSYTAKKLSMSKDFVRGPSQSLMEADMIVVIVDASNKRTRERLDLNILNELKRYPHVPSLLVMNKVDILRHKHVLLQVVESLTGAAEIQSKHRQLAALIHKLNTGVFVKEKARQNAQEEIHSLRTELDHLSSSSREAVVTTPPSANRHSDNDEKTLLVTKESWKELEVQHAPPRLITRWPHFSEVFMVSALSGDGVNKLKNHILSSARPGEWLFSTSEVTDQPSRTLVEEIIREKLFLHLDKEIPYVVVQNNVYWEVGDEGKELTVYQDLFCKNKQQASIVIGPRGDTIQSITTEAREDIESLFQCRVELILNVKTAKK